MIACLAAVAGCGDDATTASDAGDVAVDASTSQPLVCSGLAAQSPGVSTRSITMAGKERSFKLSISTSYDATKGSRLVFGWHGLGGDGALFQFYTKVEEEAAANPGDAATIFVYPDGLEVPSLGATGWTLDDLDFFDAMVAELGTELCIDSSRIFSYGHSFGAYLSNVLGCARGNSVRAIAPVAGGLMQGQGACESAMPTWMAHAADDNVVALTQGIAARDKWLSENECTQSTEAVTPSPCQQYGECQSGAKVIWCETTTGGHNWPGYADSAIWNFFSSHEAML